MQSRRGAVAAAILLAALVAGCGGNHSPASDSTNPAPQSTSRSAPTPGDSSVTSSGPITAASVVSVPVQVAHTGDGDVGYRSIGSGPTVLLIMGFGGTLDSWTPQFIASLAQRHRVITFDNAGIGQTSALPSPLTITAMAEQTAALLRTLHTDPVAVLGWSMGGMIAQALTALQPTLVSHLILAATLPGDGSATSPSAAVTQKLAASVTNPAAALSLLFPPSASAASSAYVMGILSWPEYHSPSVAAATAQGEALRSWIGGTEPVGRLVHRITRPTLIADGSEDVLARPANSGALAAVIRGSRKVIYPGAGHAFLFQVQIPFLKRVTVFLA